MSSKISALTSATTPLAGTEVLPVVQSGVTTQVTVANLTAGRAVAAASLSLTTALPVASGGTNKTSFTAQQLLYGTLAQSANMTYDGTTVKFVGRLYNGDATTFGASTWAMSLGNGGVSANYWKGDATYWQNSAGTQMMQLVSNDLTNNLGNWVTGTSGKGVTTSGAFSLGLGTNGSTSQVTINTAGVLSVATNDALINGLTIGLGNSAIGTNTVVGNSALRVNTTGLRTVAIGQNSLYTNTTGNSNVSIGYNAMQLNLNGQSNTAIGSNYNYNAPLQANTSGSFNAAVGEGALASNQTGGNNSAFGIAALNSSTASNNTGVGYNSGSAITSGANNVILGSYTGSASPVSATGSNYVVFSDGAGNVRGYYDSTGNLIVPVAAKGVNFTANTAASGMTSQLLNWYEEGTWTPADASGAGLTFTGVTAKYTRIGRQVTATVVLTFPTTTSAVQSQISGLPFAASNFGQFILTNTGVVGGGSGLVSASGTTIALYSQTGAARLNSTNSTATVNLTGTYFV